MTEGSRGGSHGERVPPPGRACTRSLPSGRRDPGTGIALLNAKGEPLDGIEFGREAQETRLWFRQSPRAALVWRPGFPNRPVPLAGPGQWLRLVLAGGWSKCWVSGDGHHWGRARRPRSDQFLANDRDLCEGGRRPQEARQRGPPHPLAKLAGSRVLAGSPRPLLQAARSPGFSRNSEEIPPKGGTTRQRAGICSPRRPRPASL